MKIRDFAAHFLCQKRRFWTKIRDFAARFLLEKRRFWTKIRDFAARFSFEKRRFWTKIRENPFAEILISSTQTGDLTSNTLNLSNWTTVQLLIWKYSKKYCNGATNQHRFCGLYPTARNHSMTVIRMIRLMIWLWAVESWHHRRKTRNFKVWQRPIMRFATESDAKSGLTAFRTLKVDDFFNIDREGEERWFYGLG